MHDLSPAEQQTVSEELVFADIHLSFKTLGLGETKHHKLFLDNNKNLTTSLKVKLKIYLKKDVEEHFQRHSDNCQFTQLCSDYYTKYIVKT